MEREQYELMFRREDQLWWYLGMRRITEGLLERFFRPATARPEVLDAGCGTGGTTAWLRRWGRVTGLDYSALGLDLARKRGLDRLLRGSIEALPFASESFDLVTSFEVIYHLGVGDDLAALGELQRVLRPGGLLLVRVPAHDSLRGAHDRAVHTRHRYERHELAGKIAATGLTVERISYANSLLYPVARTKRLLEGRQLGGGEDLWLPPKPLNSLLERLLGLEAGPIAERGLPWGLSLVAVARKPASGGQGSGVGSRGTLGGVRVQGPRSKVQGGASEGLGLGTGGLGGEVSGASTAGMPGAR